MIRQTGITPACAGNRGYMGRVAAGGMDHPRLRGEQLGAVLVRDIAQGSPPLARGTVWLAILNAAGRITPACAGNSVARNTVTDGGRDHPRLRGEQSIIPRLPRRPAGSPPLARGTVIL